MKIIITEQQLNDIKDNYKIDKKNFFGVCNKVRSLSNENEQKWYEMMKNKKKVTFKFFIDNTKMYEMLDDDETPENYIKDSIRSDSKTSAYISNWGDEEVLFLQSAGFEFIFK